MLSRKSQSNPLPIKEAIEKCKHMMVHSYLWPIHKVDGQFTWLRKPRTAIMFLVHVSRSPHPFRGHIRVSCSWLTFAFPVHGSRSRFPYVARVSRSCFSSTAPISRSGANVSRSRSRRVHVSHVSVRQLL